MAADVVLRWSLFFLLSFFAAVAVLYCAADPRSLQAQTAIDGTISKEEAYRLKKLFEKPSGSSGSSTMAARQQAMTVAGRSKWTGLSRAVVTKGGLAGVAAGIWIHNGVTLYYGLQGQPDPVPLHLSPEFRQAELALGGGSPGAGGTFKYYEGDTVVGSGMATNFNYSYDASTNKCTLTVSFMGQTTNPTSGFYGRSGMLRSSSTQGSTSTCSGSVNGSPRREPPTFTNTQTEGNTEQSGVRYRFYTQDSGGPNSTVQRFVGPEIVPGRNTSWNNPVFDMGPGDIIEAPPSGGAVFESQPQQTEEFYRQVQNEGCPTGTVASPEAPTVPEVCPDYFPAEWEEEFDEETDQKPGESPYDDPDQDGKPNHEDPDDDGDEIPDEEDTEVYVPSPTSPAGDPDEDGTPNRDDTDDDGDGIPDEVDPEPYTPTDPADLPEDHPYADPDKDGIPNVNDPDDDGDGREDGTDDQPLMPFYSPRADPDSDGIPNEDDKNDDGDPAEDWEDDNPWSPETPSNPDQDADEDGVPDWSDPWPGNPYAPTDPSRDEDGDQIPDYKDPEPLDPLVPWSPSEFRPDRQTSPPNYPESPWSPSDAPWSPTTPGTPNMPNSPTNPNVPNTPATPEMPGDPSTGTANPPPTRTDVPDDPNTEASPDEPPPPSGPLFLCPAELKPSFVLPPVDFEEKFPFSLILGAKNVLGQLVTTPKAPVFDLPMLGPQDLSRFDGVMSMMRTVWLVILGGILMPIMFYRLIRGSDE